MKDPFDYWVIDDFVSKDIAKQLSKEFIEYDSSKWYCYNNPLENKKSCNDWWNFPPKTYEFFMYLSSSDFVQKIKDLTGIKNLYPDIGLHGAGWHIHGTQGKLNIHLDYSIHPKLNLQRKLNLILYLTEDWNPDWGGGLELWSHNSKTNKPKDKRVVIENVFNRAVLFDTTQNSWHGFPNPLTCPEKIYRKSIAFYYLTDPPPKVETRKRALYAPYGDQKYDPKILDLIKQRSL
jgi:Rps23 Pro-64 3,4-dihydroxylase Tpa1-like proline 4-hydroxylase